MADVGFLFFMCHAENTNMWSCLVSRREDKIKICNKSFESVDGIVQIFGNNPNKAKLHL